MRLAPTTIALIEDLLQEHDCADIAGIVRKRQSIIVSYADVLAIYQRIAVEKLGRKRVVLGGREVRLLPDDFAAYAGIERNTDLMARYSVSVGVITRWRKETGIAPPEHRHLNRKREGKPVPDGFVLVAPHHTEKALRLRYGVGPHTIQRWLSEAGVACRRQRIRVQFFPSAPVTSTRDMSNVGQAADYLRRYGSVFRCAPTGKPDKHGSYWNRGGYVLTNADILDRASRLGWDADAWRRVA